MMALYRARLNEVLRREEVDCGSCSRPLTYPVEPCPRCEQALSHLADALLPLLARARAEGAAEALREAADELPRWALTLPNGADPQEVADWLDARADRRAAALSAPTTTEGDPT